MSGGHSHATAIPTNGIGPAKRLAFVGWMFQTANGHDIKRALSASQKGQTRHDRRFPKLSARLCSEDAVIS